jgi:hypothetical protein
VGDEREQDFLEIGERTDDLSLFSCVESTYRICPELSHLKGALQMQSVKVHKSGVSTDEAAEVLRGALGTEYQVEEQGDGTLIVSKGLAKAVVTVRPEHGGTVFDIAGKGSSLLPLFNVVTKTLSDRGIAARAAAAIGDAEAFRDDS